VLIVSADWEIVCRLKAALVDWIVCFHEVAVQKMLKGETTFVEVIRVTGEKI